MADVVVLVVRVIFGLLLVAGVASLVAWLRWDNRARAEIRDLERRIREADRG